MTFFYCRKTLTYLKKKGYKIIVGNYLKGNLGTSSNEFLENISMELDLPFCNNRLTFLEYFRRGDAAEIISDDKWHPNDKGYYLMAKNFLNKIIEEGFIEEHNTDIQ